MHDNVDRMIGRMLVEELFECSLNGRHLYQASRPCSHRTDNEEDETHTTPRKQIDGELSGEIPQEKNRKKQRRKRKNNNNTTTTTTSNKITIKTVTAVIHMYILRTDCNMNNTQC
jgi:hypothetical protein